MTVIKGKCVKSMGKDYTVEKLSADLFSTESANKALEAITKIHPDNSSLYKEALMQIGANNYKIKLLKKALRDTLSTRY